MNNDLLATIDPGTKSGIAKRRIINHYIYNGNSTIAELSKALDISIPTATKLIEEMCDSGVLLSYGKLETTEGRHPHLYGLNPTSGYFLGVDINLGAANIGLMDFNGKIVEHRMGTDYRFDNTPAGLEKLCDIIEGFIGSLDIGRDNILNVHVNLSGRVNPEAGYSYSWFNTGEEPVANVMSQRLGIDVTIDNDSRAMTYGEYLCGNVSSRRNVLFINLSWGLGMGMIIDGRIYIGNSGFAGELGHYPCYDNEVICHCGKKGCLETEASGVAIKRKLIERVARGESTSLSDKIRRDPDSVKLRDIVDALGHEDVLCIDLVEEVGRQLGRHIAGLINIFNPEEVVIGGVLSQAGDYILQPVRTAIRKHSLNMVNRDTLVSLSRLKERGGMIGACMLARARLFDSTLTSLITPVNNHR